MLISVLRSDLERQFHLAGQVGRKPTTLEILLRLPHPRFLPIVIYRLARASFLVHMPILPWLCTYANIVLFGIELSPRCEIGPGLFLPHTSGTVIGAWRIGSNATIFQNVTLGAKTLDMGFEPKLRPELGDGVTLGAGAKILGGIRIGDNAIVGANSVVLESVEPYARVAGIPARPSQGKS